MAWAFNFWATFDEILYETSGDYYTGATGSGAPETNRKVGLLGGIFSSIIILKSCLQKF